jgi:hypothetical protein
MDESNPLWAAKVLGEYANHFEISDWNYTRNLGSLESINYSGRRDSLWKRIKASLEYLRGDNDFINIMSGGKAPSLKDRWSMAKIALTYQDRNLPDGLLDNGAIITFWEETGEYLQLVQPSVGALLAEFLIDEPNNPHAQKISKEILRILEDYKKRVDNG